MNIYGEYFYGNRISDYGLQNGYVDYGTLAKAFAAVLNNDIKEKTEKSGLGYWVFVGRYTLWHYVEPCINEHPVQHGQGVKHRRVASAILRGTMSYGKTEINKGIIIKNTRQAPELGKIFGLL